LRQTGFDELEDLLWSHATLIPRLALLLRSRRLDPLAKRPLRTPTPVRAHRILSQVLRIEPQQIANVARRAPGHLLQVDLEDGGHGPGHVDDEGRLVALAAVRNRRQVRGIGLDDKRLQPETGDDLAQGLRILERHDAGERDEKAEVDARARLVESPAEAVQDAAGPVPARSLLEDGQEVCPGFPAVDRDRKPALARHVELAAEDRPLDVAARVIVVVVEPD